MRIGIPKDNLNDERRVGLASAGVDSLVRAGHTVYVESGAGLGSHFSDEDYIKTGAQIVYNKEEVYIRSEMIVRVSPLADEVLQLLQEGQIIFTGLHLPVGKKNTVETLLKKKNTAIGYELIEDQNGLPILHAMSEIAGRLSIQIA